MAKFNYNIRFKGIEGRYEDNPLQANNLSDLLVNIKEVLEHIFDSDNPDYIDYVSKRSPTGEYFFYDWEKHLRSKLKGLEANINKNKELVERRPL